MTFLQVMSYGMGREMPGKRDYVKIRVMRVNVKNACKRLYEAESGYALDQKDRKFYRVVEARRTENGRCILVTGPKERVSSGPGFVGTVGAHIDNGFQIPEVVLQLVVVRCNITARKNSSPAAWASSMPWPSTSFLLNSLLRTRRPYRGWLAASI